MEQGVTRRRGARFHLVLAVSSGAAAFAAFLIALYPFGGDQSLFAVFARMLSEGSELYVDLWDVKQPGIFWFYLLAGWWNGFSPVGVHVFEALWWIGGSVAVAFVLRRHVARDWVAGLFPLLAPGIYFAVATPGELTQVEPLISLLVVAIVLLLEPSRTGRSSALLAGMATGLIAIFKLAAVVVPAVVLVTAIVLARKRFGDVRDVFSHLVNPFLLGIALPLAVLVGWVLSTGTGDIVWFTWFEYPPQVLEVNPRPLGRLAGSAQRFVLALAPVGVLAVYRLVNRAKRGRNLSWLLAAALGGSVVLVVAQLWWSYLFFVMVAPLGILAVQGLDDLMNTRRIWVPATLVISLACIPAGYWTAAKVFDMASLATGATLAEYRGEFAGHARALEELEVVNVNENESIYVLGDPSILYQSGADQGIAINGWSPEFWTEALWDRVGSELGESRLDWVYVADWAAVLAEERAPAFEDQLLDSYEVRAVTDSGRWLAPTSRG